MQNQPAQDHPRSPVFRRELPGGGYVVIGVERPSADRVARTWVWVERRGDGRQPQGDAPIIASVEGDERSPAFTDMYRLAADNAAIARGLLEWNQRAPAREAAPRNK
jgi:hypothetical protein